MSGATYDLEFKKDDTFSLLFFQIVRRDTGEPIPITDAPTMRLKKPGESELSDGGGSVAILDAFGRCAYSWVGADTDTSGVIECEAIFTHEGKQGTVPGDRFFLVRVHDH